MEATSSSFLSPLPFFPLTCLSCLLFSLTFHIHTQIPAPKVSHMLQQYAFLSHSPGSCCGKRLTWPPQDRKAQVPENSPFPGPWETGGWCMKVREEAETWPCNLAAPEGVRGAGVERRAKYRNHITRWHSLPERSWKRAHSASESPTPAPQRNGADTRTRCNAHQRPGPAPVWIWRVSWKRTASLLISQYRVPFCRHWRRKWQRTPVFWPGEFYGLDSPWNWTIPKSWAKSWTRLSNFTSLFCRHVHAKLLQSCPTPWDSMGCSQPGSSVHGILQERVLKWVAISSSRGYSWPRDRTHISCIVGGFFTTEHWGSPLYT